MILLVGEPPLLIVKMKFKIVIKHIIEEEQELELSYDTISQALDDAEAWLYIYNDMAGIVKTSAQNKNQYVLKSITEVKDK